MSCPKILLQPVIRTTEGKPFGDVTVHWHEPVTRYAVVMLGGHDVRVVDYDEDGGLVDERIDLRVRLAATIAAHGRLGDDLHDVLAGAAIDPAGSPRTVSLTSALAIHAATARWADEEYAAWAEQLAGGRDPWARSA